MSCASPLTLFFESDIRSLPHVFHLSFYMETSIQNLFRREAEFVTDATQKRVKTRIRTNSSVFSLFQRRDGTVLSLAHLQIEQRNAAFHTPQSVVGIRNSRMSQTGGRSNCNMMTLDGSCS